MQDGAQAFKDLEKGALRSEKEPSDIIEYICSLPNDTLNRIYLQPSSCVGIMRMLPEMAKYVYMRFLYIDCPVKKSDMEQWYPSGSKLHVPVLKMLIRLNILETLHEGIKANSTFQRSFRKAVLGEDLHNFAKCISSAKQVTRETINKYVTKSWEDVLYYLIGIVPESPFGIVRKLLFAAGLKKFAEIDPDSITNEETIITKKGFDFLLEPTETQIWLIVLHYICLAESIQSFGIIDVLNFILNMENLETFQCYSMESLSKTQQVVLNDLKHFGLFYVPNSSPNCFYPTILAKSLASGTLDSLSNNLGLRKSFIIVETNYRLYAYTDSPLDIAILSLFASMQLRFRNMASGVITRSSILSVFNKGITANQIIRYITMHAHPVLLAQNPVLPLTVVDQIRLWENELNYVKSTQGYLYTGFSGRQEYEALLKHTQPCGYLIWKNDEKMQIFVTQEGNAHIKQTRSSGKSDNAH